MKYNEKKKKKTVSLMKYNTHLITEPQHTTNLKKRQLRMTQLKQMIQFLDSNIVTIHEARNPTKK